MLDDDRRSVSTPPAFAARPLGLAGVQIPPGMYFASQSRPSRPWSATGLRGLDAERPPGSTAQPMTNIR